MVPVDLCFTFSLGVLPKEKQHSLSKVSFQGYNSLKSYFEFVFTQSKNCPKSCKCDHVGWEKDEKVRYRFDQACFHTFY